MPTTKGTVTGIRTPGHFGLFVTYFPHLIAGPVLHHAQMMPQFRECRDLPP
jgi:alginate O-acetyltransferase complex protein AlgI